MRRRKWMQLAVGLRHMQSTMVPVV